MPVLRSEITARINTLVASAMLFSLISPAAHAQNDALRRAMQTLVQVNITTETPGSPESVVEFGGKVLRNYQPTIIGWFPSSGIVIDDKGYVLTFVGYRWVDIYARNHRVEIVDAQGQRHPGKLVGIDQNMRVAVVLCQGAGLKRTPVCEKRCDIKNGASVVLPGHEVSTGYQLQSARVVSVNADSASPGDEWTIKIDRPLSVIGAPLLNAQNQVLGLIADQPVRAATPNPAVDVVNVSILGVSQLLSSAGKIIAAGGDIQTGWLGVNVKSDVDTKYGVTIDSVERGSPAYKAGILPDDVVTKWNGTAIHDLMKFIHMIEDSPLGSRATVDILRQGRPMQLTAVIEARKLPDPSEKLVFDFPNVMALPGARITTGDTQVQSLLGIELVLLTPQLAESLQMPVQSGLLIASVNKQTAFDLAGIVPGDVIVRIDGERVNDQQSLYEHIKTRGWGSKLVLRLIRRGVQLTKTVQLPVRKDD